MEQNKLPVKPQTLLDWSHSIKEHGQFVHQALSYSLIRVVDNNLYDPVFYNSVVNTAGIIWISSSCGTNDFGVSCQPFRFNNGIQCSRHDKRFHYESIFIKNININNFAKNKTEFINKGY